MIYLPMHDEKPEAYHHHFGYQPFSGVVWLSDNILRAAGHAIGFSCRHDFPAAHFDSAGGRCFRDRVNRWDNCSGRRNRADCDRTDLSLQKSLDAHLFPLTYIFQLRAFSIRSPNGGWE